MLIPAWSLKSKVRLQVNPQGWVRKRILPMRLQIIIAPFLWLHVAYYYSVNECKAHWGATEKSQKRVSLSLSFLLLKCSHSL